MKILTIESPQRLKDRTVKASITVAEDDYIPLIVMSNEAYKGKEIELDIRKSDNEPKAEELPDFIRSMWAQYAQGLKESYERGRKDEYDRAFVKIEKLHPNTLKGDELEKKLHVDSPDMIGKKSDPELAEIKEGVKSSIFGTFMEEEGV